MRLVSSSLKKLFALTCITYMACAAIPSMGLGANNAHKIRHQNAPKNARLNQVPTISLIQRRKRRSLNHLYVFETSPLGNRIPVVLVPGRAEEYQQNAWWKKIHQITYKNPNFEKDFKLYAFIYDSKLELDEQAKALSKELLLYFKDLPATQKTILISYSLGGVMSREAMEDPQIFNMVHTIFAIGVPFHGTPIFDSAWFRTYMMPKNFSIIRKWEDRLIYRLYLFNKTNLTRGLKWDNFDSSRPEFQANSDISGDQLTSNNLQYIERPTTPAIKQKMIIYASYLENKKTNLARLEPIPFHKLIESTATTLPKEIVATFFPIYGFSSHSALKFVNQQLTNLPSFTDENPKGKNTHLYKYNDGVLPLSSGLYLPSRKTPYNADLKELSDALDVQKARVFVNLDHTHLGEYASRRTNLNVVDLFHPDDGVRTPNQWLLYDLQKLLPNLKKAP